jgi:hypothetical protein
MVLAPRTKHTHHFAIRLDNLLENALHEGIFDSGKTGLVAGPGMNYRFLALNTFWNYLTLGDDRDNQFIMNRFDAVERPAQFITVQKKENLVTGRIPGKPQGVGYENICLFLDFHECYCPISVNEADQPRPL